MAPRTAKAKKAADVKVAENDAPKKGRGKAKITDDTEQEVPEIEIDDKPALADKKAKRGKKAQENGDAQTNGVSEEAVPAAKRGRKKKEVEPEESAPEATNGDSSAEETPPADDEQNEDQTESLNTEEAPLAATGKGRKKPTKKEDKPKETTRGKKAKQGSPEDDEEKEDKVEEKPKSKGRGRKPKAETAPEPEPEEKTETAEEVKTESTAKGRRKGPGKAAKDKSPEPEESNEEIDKHDEVEEKPAEAPKKETKGRKGKKAPVKDEGESEEKEPASKKRKVNKKEGKGQGDSKDDDVADVEVIEQEVEESKPAKGKRGKKAEASAADVEDELQDSESSAKRRRKPIEEKAPAKGIKTKAPAKNKTTTNYEEIDFSNSSMNPQGKEWNFKIASWNVDGIRAWASKGGLDYLKYEKPDILCVQETKCSKDKLPSEVANVPGYHAYWAAGGKDGHAGVGVYSTRLAISVQYGLGRSDLDDAGRAITAEYEQFYLVCVYVPNAGRKLVTLPKRLSWNDEFLKHVQELDKKKPVIVCGDMNVAHNEIDLANPKSNTRNAGFTAEERAGLTQLLGVGLADCYRRLHPARAGAYTFWTYMMNARARNVGWRLDYFLASERLLPSICDSVIRQSVYGSDHCPIALYLHLSSADKPKDA